MEVRTPIPKQSVGRTFAVAISLLGLIAFAQALAVSWVFIQRFQASLKSTALSTPGALEDEDTAKSLNLADTFVTVDEPAAKPMMPRPTPVPMAERATGAEAVLADQIEQARTLRNRGDTVTALTRLKEAERMAPDSAEVVSELAFTYEKMGLTDKSLVQWRRIYDMGESTGALYSAAQAKLQTPAPAAAGAAATSGAAPQVPGIEQGKNLGILDITTSEQSDPASEKKLTVRIPIKKRTGLDVDVRDVIIQVLFYDLLPDASVAQTSANVSSHWTTVPADWSDDDIEILEVEYNLPKEERGEKRTYFGYIARVYYQRDLQAWRAEPAKLRAQYPPPHHPHPRRTETMKILLVDDETAIIQAILPLLKTQPGYDVRVALTGEKALEQASALGGVDLLISDVVMDPMDGFTLKQEMKRLYPGVRTIFITGYDLSEYPEQTKGHIVLMKPIKQEDLLAAVAAVGETTAAPPRPAVSVSAPQAVAVPQATARPVAVAAAVVEDEFIGKVFGNYRLIRKLGEGEWGDIYGAMQTSMNRPVTLQLLSPAKAADPAQKSLFLTEASAKANVQHPHILSVYEAGEAHGHTFYTREFIEGETLAASQEKGRHIDEITALRAIRIVAEGLSHLNQAKTPHLALSARDIYIDNQRQPRLANLATSREIQPTTQEEIKTLSQAILSSLPGSRATEPGLQAMLGKMQIEGAAGFLSWGALLQTVRVLEPKVIPADAFKLSAQDQMAIKAVELAKKQQKRQLILSIAGFFLILWVAAGVIAWKLFFTSDEKSFDKMIEIPAGEFIYQNGEKAKTDKAFWIDEHEVTLGQYAKFLKHLEEHPEDAGKFDHARQPQGKIHKPKDWDVWYGRASSGLKKYRVARFVPLNVNCPVFNVDYWDAYAYAQWKGRRLPTEIEWEKAARGTDGRLYPWGKTWEPKNTNGAGDYIPSPNPTSKATVDGYFWFAPVDAFGSDKSPYGVIGMAGNVYEWTDTWMDDKFPVVRGGSFRSIVKDGPDKGKPDCTVTRRAADIDPEIADVFIGFRTASDTGK